MFANVLPISEQEIRAILCRFTLGIIPLEQQLVPILPAVCIFAELRLSEPKGAPRVIVSDQIRSLIRS